MLPIGTYVQVTAITIDGRTNRGWIVANYTGYNSVEILGEEGNERWFLTLGSGYYSVK